MISLVRIVVCTIYYDYFHNHVGIKRNTIVVTNAKTVFVDTICRTPATVETRERIDRMLCYISDVNRSGVFKIILRS